MSETTTYDIYHDENKENGYWHSFIFIPRDKNQQLLDLLLEPRYNLNYFNPVHFTNIKNRTPSFSEKVRIVNSWITILYYAIQQQKINAELYLGHKANNPIYRTVKGTSKKIGTKIVVFREKDNLKKMHTQMSYTKKVETTFRMGLKGGCHFLFQEEPMKIGNIYIDYPPKKFNRNYNIANILTRFQDESRDHILFATDSNICAIDKRTYKEKEMVSEFMQLADIAVGAIRTQQMKVFTPKTRYDITLPFKDILEKEVGNFARMKNSRFKNAFSLSNAWIDNEEWKFEQMNIENDTKTETINIF